MIGFLERMQGSGVQVADRQRFSRRSGQIRVAILDTGISLSDGFYDSYRDRIKSFKSWLNPNGIVEDEDVDRENDSDGHGTHAAALLLKIAPHADIYIARVFRDRRETKSTAAEIHQRIAAAIRHATEVWEVDIITMSFGFDESVRKIEEAIDFAEGKKIVMFAAASNTGGNGNIAWPARSDKVICIYPSDGYGDHCRFSPNPRDYSDNFMVLGHAVQSCWPRHLGSGSKMRKSGTSTATPIAAGIAAIVLEVVRSMPDRPHSPPKCDTDQFRKVWTNAGMKSIFRLMVRKTRSSYDYIEPWKIFDASQQGYSSETVYEKMLHRLKTRC